jgi:hypothetical protein
MREQEIGNVDASVEPNPRPFRSESPISFRVTPEWLEALDGWRKQQAVRPSRTAVIVAAVEQFIASQKKGNSVGQ